MDGRSVTVKGCENGLLFFLPNLLRDIKKVDLFIAINCLHEMRQEDICFYLDAAERMTTYFYFSCWKNTVVPEDNIRLNENDYLLGRRWNCLLHEDALFPHNYFNGLYDVNQNLKEMKL